MANDARWKIALLRRLGYVPARHNGHPAWVHPDHPEWSPITVAMTPSDWRDRKNFTALLRQRHPHAAPHRRSGLKRGRRYSNSTRVDHGPVAWEEIEAVRTARDAPVRNVNSPPADASAFHCSVCGRQWMSPEPPPDGRRCPGEPLPGPACDGVFLARRSVA